MNKLLAASFFYFTFVFVVGFMLGTARILFVIPIWGETLATILELPLMLGASWWVCRHIIKRYRLPSDIATRMGMGLLALVMLLGAEVLLGILGLGRSLTDQWAEFQKPGPLLGLLAQFLFAAFPFIQRYSAKNLNP
jgi:hypothetical protein